MKPQLKRKFALVRFDDQSTCIIENKRVCMLADNDRCIVKYLGGAKYSAELLETSGTI